MACLFGGWSSLGTSVGNIFAEAFGHSRGCLMGIVLVLSGSAFRKPAL